MTISHPAAIAVFALSLSPAIPAAAQDVPMQGNGRRTASDRRRERLVRLTENARASRRPACRAEACNMTIIEDTTKRVRLRQHDL